MFNNFSLQENYFSVKEQAFTPLSFHSFSQLLFSIFIALLHRQPIIFIFHCQVFSFLSSVIGNFSKSFSHFSLYCSLFSFLFGYFVIYNIYGLAEILVYPSLDCGFLCIYGESTKIHRIRIIRRNI